MILYSNFSIQNPGAEPSKTTDELIAKASQTVAFLAEVLTDYKKSREPQPKKSIFKNFFKSSKGNN